MPRPLIRRARAPAPCPLLRRGPVPRSLGPCAVLRRVLLPAFRPVHACLRCAPAVRISRQSKNDISRFYARQTGRSAASERPGGRGWRVLRKGALLRRVSGLGAEKDDQGG